MLVYPVLVVALGALWPLDWTHTKLDSLSPVTGHYHGTTWAMAEKVTEEDDPEEVVVVEGTTTDEVGKDKNESPKGWKQKLKEWAIEYAILDENGNFHWGCHVLLFVLMVILGTMTGVGPAVVIVVIVYFIGRKIYMSMMDNCRGGATKNLRAKTLD
uniref:Uncharacterized protein n=1 Tax=Babesia bovis TaxID=5865 RepID=S6BN12_BABBO|nr:hypothetical protein [Babesia bovis]